MITGVWLSQDRESIAIQWDEDMIYVLPPDSLEMQELDEVPNGWVTCFSEDEPDGGQHHPALDQRP